MPNKNIFYFVYMEASSTHSYIVTDLSSGLAHTHNYDEMR